MNEVLIHFLAWGQAGEAGFYAVEAFRDPTIAYAVSLFPQAEQMITGRDN